jgi:hypothetical protein
LKNASEKGIRINMKVEGEPAEWLEEWKRRGLVTSYTDAIIQSLRIYNETIVESDLRKAQLDRNAIILNS